MERNLESIIYQQLIRRLDQEAFEAPHRQLVAGPRGDAFIEFGLSSQRIGGLEDDDVAKRNEAVRRWLQHAAVSTNPNAVFMDTTTLYIAKSLITRGGKDSHTSLAPSTLLDLATFVRSVVLYDHIFHLETGYVDTLSINEALGNEPVFIPLPVTGFDGGYYGVQLHGVGAFLGNLLEDTMRELKDLRTASYGYEQAAFQNMVAAWSVVLGRVITRSDFSQEWIGDNWRSNGPQLIKALLAHSNDLGVLSLDNAALYPKLFDKFYGSKELRDMVSESNHRSLFNCRVAGILQLPYAPNIARMPFRNYLFGAASVIHERLRTIKEIEKYLARYRDSYFVPDGPNLQLPVFLAVVLKRCKTLDSFYEVLAELRAMAEPFRRRRMEYEQELQRNPKKTAALRKAIEGDVKAWSKALVAPLAGTAAAVLGAIVSGPTGLALAGFGLLAMIGQFDSDKRELIARRLLRPQEWFLISISDTAQAIGDSLDDVQRLWNNVPIDTAKFASRFAQFRQLGYG